MTEDSSKHHVETEFRFAELILPLPLNTLYTYRIPQTLDGKLVPGARVVVQFGRRRFYTAIVRHLKKSPPAGYEAKYIMELLDETPFVSERELAYWEWMSNYYMCSIGEVMNAAIPGGMKIQSETIIIPNDEVYDGELDEKEHVVMTLLEVKQKLSADDVVRALGTEHAAWKVLRSMYEKGLVWFQETYEERYRPKKVHYILLNEELFHEPALQDLFEHLEKKAPKQLELLMRYLQLAPLGSTIKKEDMQMDRTQQAAYRTMRKKGYFVELVQDEQHVHAEKLENNLLELSNEQTAAIELIHKEWKRFQVCLLQGPAGSGKTHIYLALIKEYIQKGAQVLFLLPEIALTFEFLERLKSLFGDQVLFTHSKYGTNERSEVYSRVADNSCQLLIGARSSVFMPFQNLQLIIVDEEHDSAYKQFDPSPRYHGRDAAIYLATLHNARVLLGSSTPSFETLYHVNSEKYGLVRLRKPYGNLKPPEVKLVDIHTEQKEGKLKGMFSTTLISEIQERIANDEQIILFHNQKGYVPMVQCESCSWMPRCVNCDITLTYYKGVNQMRCHYCGYKRPPFDQCNSCGSKQLKMTGFGTEKIEDELVLLIPGIKVQRFDANTVKNQNAFQQIIGDFQSGKTNVLIGTQMITKGIDFNNVSLAAVLNMDQLLQFPDFRAPERAFQLAIQLGGRTGRGGKQGTLLLQTRNPSNYLYDWLRELSYEKLYDAQLPDRERFKYPPFSRLIRIVVKGKDPKLTEHAAGVLSDQMKVAFGHNVLGPEKPYVSRVRGLFHFHILFKAEIKQGYKDYRIAKFRIKNIMDQLSVDKEFKNKVRFHADVDPM